MSNFKLNLPTDIPWERICVTEDMIDRNVCDDRLPAKWQTSLAVFKYRPEDEFQLFPKYRITYLKVSATITGYQPLDDEIQGNIDWDGVDVSTIPGLKDLLKSYNPCHGAILQVVIAPSEESATVTPDKYPFFMDFEPKKRELYEMATDTKEKQSRSLESLNLTKSAATTQSMEIMDVDMGGGGFGASASGGQGSPGGSFQYSAPNGQWGTRRLNADESLASRSSDVGQEKRETFSYTTQISQMYHLLDSYHLGTNRVVFFIQPRPHTLEEPSGFVRGPRPVDGIQEFFLIVAQLKEQKDFCVSLRLDTSHLTKIPILDYEYKSEITDLASCTAPAATRNDTLAEYIVGATACVPNPFGGCIGDPWNVYYQCYRTEANNSVVYAAPTGFTILDHDDLVNNASHGSSNIVVSPNGASLSINVTANGHNCYEDSGVCFDCDDEIQKWSGFAQRQLQVNLKSTVPTKQVGEEEVMLITTRGLCCCAEKKGNGKKQTELVVDAVRIPAQMSVLQNLQGKKAARSTFATKASSSMKAQMPTSGEQNAHDHESGMCAECAAKADALRADMSGSGTSDTKFIIRQANEMSNFMRQETIRSMNDPTLKPKKFVDTDFFAKQLENTLVQTKKGREVLKEKAGKDLPPDAATKLEKFLKRKSDQIKRQDLLSFRTEELAKVTGMKEEDIRKMKLGFLGVKFKK